MKLKISLKLGLDFTMTVLLLLSLAYPFTGNLPHEILGTALLVCFILHNLLNADWYKELLRGNYNARRTVLTLVNLLLLLVMIGLALSSILLSRKVFSFLQLEGSWAARRWHPFFAYWGFLLSAIHLGLHGGLFMPLIQRLAPAWTVWPGRIAAWAAAFYGIYALFYWKVFSHLGIASFVHIPRGRALFSFLAGHLAILFLAAAGAHLFINRLSSPKAVSGGNTHA